MGGANGAVDLSSAEEIERVGKPVGVADGGYLFVA